jgi:hypothetical protein
MAEGKTAAEEFPQNKAPLEEAFEESADREK